MFQMGRKTGVFFFEKINEVCLEKITDTILVADPGTIVLFDDLDVVASPRIIVDRWKNLEFLSPNLSHNSLDF